jgi:hypothetical protein
VLGEVVGRYPSEDFSLANLLCSREATLAEYKATAAGDADRSKDATTANRLDNVGDIYLGPLANVAVDLDGVNGDALDFVGKHQKPPLIRKPTMKPQANSIAASA